MPGLGAFALAGAVGGAGQAILDRAKQQREDALRELERKRELEDYDRRRSDSLSDYQMKRGDMLADEQRGYDRENERVSRASNVYESLFGTESGGNFRAKNDEGYNGRSQFGQDRLDDYSQATGAPRLDLETFRNNDALQEQVEQWHFSDINQFIDKSGLTEYEGKTIAGVPITRSSMIAMAHLGGKNGMKRFLETGGKYNPADSNGTSLSDYARTHGGLSTDMSEVWTVLADPNTPESVRDDIRERVGLDPTAAPKITGQEWVRQGGQEILMGRSGAQMVPITGADGQPVTRDPEPNDEYGRYAAEEREAGREPLSRIDYAQAKKGTETVFGPDGSPILSRGPSSTKFTEGQSKDNVYATRAEGAIRTLEPVANALTSRTDRVLDVVPLGIGREGQNSDFQVAQQAGEEFLQAILRKDTGAAITNQEQEMYGKTFLPQPGDGERVLEAKRASRQRAIEAIKAGMSPAQILAQERGVENADRRTNDLNRSGPNLNALKALETRNFSAMTLEQLNQVDINDLSMKQLDEMEFRYRELTEGGSQ